MTLPILSRDETLASVADSSRRWTALLHSVKDPSRTAIGHWTIRDVAVHVSHIFELFPKLMAGERSPIKDHLKIGEEWDALVKSDPEQDIGVAADRVEHATKEFLDRAGGDVWESEVSWHGGLRAPVYTLAGILINETEVHGLDVASAEGRDHVISREKAIKAIVGLFPVLPHFVNVEAASKIEATYDLQLRRGPTVYVNVAGGGLTLDVAPRRADCHLSVDPVSYLLIGYGRRSQWGPIATGKVVAWGRKPWLSLSFSKLFHSP
jgi:uncharacterized protein (TIGR03083 family)